MLRGIPYNHILKEIPFGYRVDANGSLTIQEDEAMLVREIYRLFLLRESYNRVSDEINNSENFPDHPYKFNAIKVKSILNEWFYTGDWVAISKKDNKDIVLPFHHDSIVPNEIWNQVQRLINY